MTRFIHKGISYKIIPRGEGDEAPPYVLLHGFVQSAHTWDAIALRLSREHAVYAWDLVGHGESDKPEDANAYTAASQCEALQAWIDQQPFDQIVLVGYSMGGRLAIQFAEKYPNSISRLVLESTGLGPADEDERQALVLRDKVLANRIQQSSLAEFFDYWEQLPLFASQQKLSESVRARIRSERLANDSRALCLSVENFGQHAMPDMRPFVAQAPFPLVYIAGTQDKKYSDLAKSIAGASVKTVTLEAGHNTHLETPEAFLRALTNNE